MLSGTRIDGSAYYVGNEVHMLEYRNYEMSENQGKLNMRLQSNVSFIKIIWMERLKGAISVSEAMEANQYTSDKQTIK